MRNRVAEKTAERAAKKAEREIAKSEALVARQTRREADRAAKPWLAPGLSTAEKYRLRYRHDPNFHMRERLRTQMSKRYRYRNMEYSLRKAVLGRRSTPSIEKFLGYRAADLRAHLEAQFDPTMTWQAFAEGRIHIDHKRPVKLFDLDKPDDVRDCWSLENLQPMWALDNIRKGARLL